MKHMTIAYHQVNPGDLKSILEDGLKRSSRGELGDDKAIIATDKLLDERCPDSLRALDVSRDNNIYAYVCIDDHVIDITNGNDLTVNEFVQQSEEAVLELRLDPARCFVSNLDMYDALKHAVADSASTSLLTSLAKQYWGSLVLLSDYLRDDIRRPEIMIPYDIAPTNIRACRP